MTIDDVRRMLRSANVPMSIIHGRAEEYELPIEPIPQLLGILNDESKCRWVLSEEEEREVSGFRPFNGFLDVVRWAELLIRQRLLSFVGSPIKDLPDRWKLLESLLRGALLDCLLTEFSTFSDLTPSLLKHFQGCSWRFESSDGDLQDEVEAALLSSNTRRLVQLLSPEVCNMDGRDLVQGLGLQFPPRESKINPLWVRRFQRRNRVNQFWMYNSLCGRGLFLVLYTRKCSFGHCAGCSLHQLGSTDFVTSPQIMEQISRCFDEELTSDELISVREIFLSNNGSVFDQTSMPLSALLFACCQAVHKLPNLERIVFETRAEFVNDETLNLIRQSLMDSGKHVEIEVAIGVEIFDERLRNRYYHKGLSSANLEKAIRSLVSSGIALRCYFMYRPLPEMTRDSAAEDIRNAAAFLDRFFHASSGAAITMHLNPTYVSIGSELENAFRRGEYLPVNLGEVEELVASMEGHRISIYVGLNDEGLAVEGGSFLNPETEDVLLRLRRFNRTQDFKILRHPSLPSVGTTLI